MPFRVYFDEDSSRKSLISELRRLGWDVLVATEVGNAELTDSEQLAWAHANHAAIVTANQRDFARLHREWSASGRVHSGIIVVTDQGTSPGDVVRGLTLMASRLSQVQGRIEFLAHWIRAARHPSR